MRRAGEPEDVWLLAGADLVGLAVVVVTLRSVGGVWERLREAVVEVLWRRSKTEVMLFSLSCCWIKFGEDLLIGERFLITGLPGLNDGSKKFDNVRARRS